jgi:hypothetical protein
VDGFGRVNGLVIDRADTMGLARFWGAVFGTSIGSVAGDSHHVDLKANDRVPLLRFQRVADPEGNGFCVISQSEDA